MLERQIHDLRDEMSDVKVDTGKIRDDIWNSIHRHNKLEMQDMARVERFVMDHNDLKKRQGVNSPYPGD